MAETIFSSQSSAEALSANSCDMKEIIAMWDPRPGDNSLGPDFRRGAPPQEVASLEQKFESAQDMLSQRTSSLGKRDFSALVGGEGSRHSLELNGGTPKMMRTDSSRESFGKVLLGEGTLLGFERGGSLGGVKSESSRDGVPGGVPGGPTSFAGLIMQPPMLPGTIPLGFRHPPPLQPLPPFPRTLPPNVSRSIPLNPPPPRLIPVPPLHPPMPTPRNQNSAVQSTGAGGSGRSGSGGDRNAGDGDPQKTQREKNMLKSRRHRLRKKAQETLLREKIVKLEAELTAVRGELSRVANEGRREISRLQEENVRLRTELSRRASAPLRGIPQAAPGKNPGEQSTVGKSPGDPSTVGNPAEEIEKLQAENRTLKEGYRNVLATMNELMQTKAS
ncbi:hypothetical protein KFL_000390340 [Klebsormidium nitens]|uniref:BZIP domain-containing protein n=1 Tax=Klebsormidium nitens TaxID=105231 RepID=A0A1Y1HMJ3_KLENI|nr:hypothetical protein KFL_000390340 [Klebsormidium nitens]|eukprot:GAQ79845.1 hypothetical protein KFL_000390340 [Klebsormidium nitens]